MLNFIMNAVLLVQTIAMAWILASRIRVMRWKKRSFWVDALLPPKIAQDVQDNFRDLMPVWKKAHGGRKARRILRIQTFLVIVGHYTSPIKAIFDAVRKLI